MLQYGHRSFAMNPRATWDDPILGQNAYFLKGFAMSNVSKRIHILDIEQKKSKAGNAYWVAQCVVYDRDNKPKVGELWHFNKDVELKTGEFTAVFEVDVDMDRKVSSSLTALSPYVKPAGASGK